MFINAPSTPLDVSPFPQGREPCCMYITDCDTGSQLRKAVSHIFGRNKMCTRRIPTHVWVWYCRKHYQRARYRNSKEWARTLQYDLVTRQIDRLQQWSDANRRLGEGDVVRDYTLAIRKREQRRIDAQKSRRDHDFSDSEEDTSVDVQDASSTTAVPDWLLNQSGRNYDATAIHQIIDDIKEDLASGKLSAWPDIEILPNIIKDDEEGPSSGLAGRKPPTVTHKRSQSLSATQKTDFPSTHRNVSRTRIIHSTGRRFSVGLSQKRKRFDDGDEDDNKHESLEDRRVRGNGRLAAIEAPGNRQCRLENSSRVWDCHSINHGHPSSQIFAPQRYDAPSRIPQFASNMPIPEDVSPKARNTAHQRSHSDVDTLFNQQPISHTSSSNRVRLPSMGLDPPTAHRHSVSPGPQPSLTRGEAFEQRPPLHSRHQSTPLISNPLRTLQAQDAMPRSYQPAPLIRTSPSHRSLENGLPDGKRD